MAKIFSERVKKFFYRNFENFRRLVLGRFLSDPEILRNSVSPIHFQPLETRFGGIRESGQENLIFREG